MKKHLLSLLLIFMSVATVFAADPDVTITLADFDLPTAATQSEVEYSDGNITIGIFNGKKQTSQGSVALFLTKASGYIKLPAFASAVEKIVLYSNPGASAKAVVQVKDGESVVGSVATTTADNTTPYEVAIAEDSRNASAEYKIIPTSAANAQISKIEVYLVGGAPVPTLEEFVFEGFHDYLLNPGDLVEWSLGSMDKPAIVFASSDEDVAMADESGILAGVAGTAEITATWAADERFAAGSATFSVEVKGADVPVLVDYQPAFADKEIEVSLADGQYQLELGESHPAEMIFVVEDETVASIDDNGLLTLKAAGMTMVDCMWSQDATFTEGEASFILTVKGADTPEPPVVGGEKALALVYTGKTYSGDIADKVETTGEGSGVFSYTVPGVLDFTFEGANGSEFRVYAGKDIVFKPAQGVTLTKVVFKDTNSKTTTISADKGNCSTVSRVTTWTGSVADVLTINTTAQIRIDYFEIYYTVEGGDTPDPKPEKTVVTLGWSAECASATVGEEFEAPVLSVDPEAAAAAVCYKSDNEEVATVDESGKVSVVAAGEAAIIAYIPAENEEYTAEEASYILTVKSADTPIIPDPVTGGSVTLDKDSFGLSGTSYAEYAFTDEFGVSYQSVASLSSGCISFNTNNKNGGKASGIVVTANKDNVMIQSVAVKFSNPGKGLNIYAQNDAYDALVLGNLPSFSADPVATEVMDETPVEINATAFAIVPVTTGQILIESITVTYAEAGEKAEVSDVRVAATVTTEEVAETVKGVAVTSAAAFRLTGSALTTAASVAFEYEGKAWIVAAEDGKVDFTADYVPAPDAASVLSYYGVDAEGNAVTDKAEVAVSCAATPAEKYSLTLDGHKFKATVNEENTAVMLDLKLAHSLVHHKAANAELPYLVDYKLTSANHGELEVSYDLATDTATVKNFIVIDIDPASTIDDIALMLEQFEFQEEHSLEAEPELLFPVLVAAEPVVVAGAPAQAARRAAAFEAALPELTLVSGTPAKADSEQPLIALPHTKMVMNDDVATGIESVAADLLDAPAEYYNLQGIRILNPAKGQVVIRRQANGHVDKLRF